MQRIVRDRARKFAFDWEDSPELRVQPGESFVIETWDASSGYFKGAGDLAGPLDLALSVRLTAEPDAAGETKRGSRLIVVGDSDFVTPQLLEAPELANFHIASAWTGFLTERAALIEIPPKKVKGGNIVFTQDDLMGLVFRLCLLLPGSALVLGVAVWFNRRS